MGGVCENANSHGTLAFYTDPNQCSGFPHPYLFFKLIVFMLDFIPATQPPLRRPCVGLGRRAVKGSPRAIVLLCRIAGILFVFPFPMINSWLG